MIPALAQRKRIRLSLPALLAGALSIGLILSQSLQATPIALQQSFAGNLDFVITGGTLRTQPNSVDPCAVTTGPVTASLSGIPAGATIRAAFLYWGGSGPNVDDQVTLDGNSVFANRVFTENYVEPGVNEFYFGGVSDVTSIVQGKGNGTYSFSGLTVTNTNLSAEQSYCTFGVVYSGWGLVAIYEHPSEPFRVVNMYDGLQTFYGSQITLTPDNLRIPVAPIDGKLAVLTFEGDAEIATTRNGFTESIRVNNNLLTDGLNPANNQYNSTINQLGLSNTYGVDFDIYSIGSFLNAGDTFLTSQYSSGGDWVQLMLQVVSATSDPASDLSITKQRNIIMSAGGAGQYRLSVRNNGPITEPGPIVVTDVLDARLTYNGFSGTNWSCSNAGQTVTCTHPGPLAVNAVLPNLLLDVQVQAGTGGQVISNTASVAGQNFDNISTNNSSTTNDYIYGPITAVKQLYAYFASAAAPNTNSLRRVIPTTNTETTGIDGGASTSITLNPAVVRPLTLRAGVIEARVCSRRSGTVLNTNRAMRVRLEYTGAANGVIGTSAAQSFTGTAWTSRLFGVTLASDLTLPPGTSLRLVIENTSAAANRRIDVSSTNCPQISRVDLDTSTVVNVEEVEVFNAAYPAGTPITTAIDNGGTVYVRSRISDPFGSFDITGAQLDLFDKDDNLVAGPIAMSVVEDSVATGERIFEVAGTVPNWTGSPYSVRVRGDEGTEGTVFHFEATAFSVTPQPPLLMVTKLASSPTVDPGSVVSYTVQVSNAGTGAAAGVEVVDTLSRFLSLGIDTFAPGEAVEFVDGSPSSELTPEPVEFSNDGGATYIYSPVSGGGGAPAGYDSNITNFRVPFTGDMPPGGSFTLNYDAIVD